MSFNEINNGQKWWYFKTPLSFNNYLTIIYSIKAYFYDK